jgi:acetyl esterase/lipase
MNEAPTPPMPSDPPPSKQKPDEVKVYKVVSGTELKAHVFFPKTLNQPGIRPAFVFFHPGGWTMGEPEWGYDLCHHFSQFDMVAISFEYRLSSIGGNCPADAVMDAKSAMRWTREHSSELGIDSSMIMAGGISAGGHLAVCTAMIPGIDDPEDNMIYSPVPQAIALQSTPVNPAIDGHFLQLLHGREKPEDLSPAHHVAAGVPPMCLIQGTADEIVPYDSVKEFALKMQEAGNNCKLHTFDGTDHFFMNKTDQARAIKLIDEFITAYATQK